MMKPRLLLNDLKPGEDEGKVSWYPEPHFIVHKTDETGYYTFCTGVTLHCS